IIPIFFPLQRFYIICFTLLFIIYEIAYNMYIIHNAHPLTVMSLITFSFWMKKNRDWKLLWQGLRYYICFIYFASFLWKAIFGGALFYWNTGVNSVKLNLAEYIYHNPETNASLLLKYFIAHPLYLNLGYIFIVLLEGLMAVGFFTRKYDKYLLMIPVFIHVSTYFFSDVFFIEMLVLIFLFFSDKQINSMGNKLPFLAK
ncbi:MAG: hypothetical protein M3004_02870, partial [Bacteroidota bacterium]|nr:hypothetical protein [Bacteroidota bacterium]